MASANSFAGSLGRDGADYRLLRILQYAAAIATGVFALGSLVGWLTGALVLASGKEAYVPMAPLTAASFLIFSMLLIFRLRVASPRGRGVVYLASGLISGALVLEVMDIALGAPLSMGRLFVVGVQSAGSVSPARMSPIAAAAFLGISLSFVLFENPGIRARSAATIASLLVVLMSFVLSVGYALDAPFLYGSRDIFAVALPTALGLLLLGFGTSAFGFDRWPYSLFMGDSIRAWLMRVVVPAAVLPMIIVTVVDGILFDLVENPAALAMLFILMLALIGIAVSAAAARTGNRLDEAEKALRESETRYRSLFESDPDGIVILDPETVRLVEFNTTAHTQLGYTREEFIRLHLSDIEAVETPEVTRARIDDVLRDGRSDWETQHRTKGGESRHMRITAQAIDIDGRTVLQCIWRDVTERVRLREKLAMQASTDDLTGVANRRQFIKVAEEELKRSVRYGHPMAMAIMDVDDLKNINDTYGHLAGDQLLRHVANSISAAVRNGDVLGRFGGDEFVLMMPETSAIEADTLVSRIQDVLAQEPLRLDGADVGVFFSAGVSELSQEVRTVDELIAQADIMLYASKAAKSDGGESE